MKYTILYAAFLILFGLNGCASEAPQSTSSQQHAECLVCKMNFDLACVDVPVNTKTPTLMYNDKTYFFCSDDCRDKFAKDPAKYATK